MTHKERLIAALERHVPDQVPITWEMEGRFAQTLTGRADWRGICDAHRMLGSSIFNVQGIGPGLSSNPRAGYSQETWSEDAPGGASLAGGAPVPSQPPGPAEGDVQASVGEIEVRVGASLSDAPAGARLHHRRITTPKGTLHGADLAGYMPHDPLVGKHVEYPIKQRSDWEIYADYISEMARTAEPSISESLAAYDYIGDDGLVGGWMADSIYHIAHLRRDTEFILDLQDEPDLMEQVLQAVDPYSEALVRSFNESKIECLVYDICWASLSLLSPAMVRRFVIPRAKRIVELVAPGKFIVFFQTGRIREVVPDLVGCRPHGIQHFDVLGDCDLAEIKRSFGKDICIIGNLSPVILAHGSVEEAKADARRCLAAAKEGGAYIMSTSDELPVDARLENLKAIVEVVGEEGRY